MKGDKSKPQHDTFPWMSPNSCAAPAPHTCRVRYSPILQTYVEAHHQLRLDN